MRCAVLGDPVGHSLSPTIHRAAYDALGLEGWHYDAVEVPSGEVAEFVHGLDPTQWRGLSLTMPLKREAVALLDTQDDWVRLSAACNTIVLDDAGRRHGLNTDVTGAVAVLERHDVPLERALVLGGGATAASVALALVELGTRRVSFAVRDTGRLTETVRVTRGHPRGVEVDVLTLEEIPTARPRADVLVSTVPASVQVPALLAATAEVPVVFDVVYEPWPTPLADAARTFGATVISGLDLLVAQAADQVVAMTGRPQAPVEAMRRAAEESLESRRAR